MPKIMHVLDHLSKVNHDKTLWEIPIFGDEIFFGTYIEQTFSERENKKSIPQMFVVANPAVW